ncbi:hypothetical protein [Halomarina oriensis]|uniref:HhH-GPD domain-containing protein n=1 Tax=Halomarina oriensis TaxID=671145 RepID=A0A6B0GTH6_9EURY|nr:hypothetical protein [Halomarina oriensis]MWG36677.1 hypothetical protein [Halomarina oriensis]
MTSTDHPFGRTTTTLDELHGCVDVTDAKRVLNSIGVAKPDKAVEGFLDQMPTLLAWLDEHGRDYPWRRASDPWQIYASEILLQRTRSDAVADIYPEFFAQFPSARCLLEADEEDLRSIVHPLGFVNHRVRTLREAAELCAEVQDEVPADLEALQQPWRVGPYTARACLLFAFDQPMALVDTNTARIVGRVFDYPLPEQPHKSTRVQRLLDALAPDNPALARAFNLALLDLGALVCTSENPNCPACPLAEGCEYAQTGDV